jgi:hypothetical protein
MKKQTKKEEFPGYPIYPESEDIYSRAKETELDPEQLTKKKDPAEKTGKLNEKNFKDDVTGGDLDVPGSELDDAQEDIGSEDEENNIYSFGGDNHDK